MVKSLLEGGGATRAVSHRHVLPLLAAHVSDTEQPMLLFPKTSLGTLKGLLMRCREPKRGASLVGSGMEGSGVGEMLREEGCCDIVMA